MFYGLSMFPDFFSKRINLFVALAPVVNLKVSNSPILGLGVRIGGAVEKRLNKAGVYELFGKGWTNRYGFVRRLIPMANRVVIRSDMMNLDLDDEERTSMLMGHFPHGTSLRNMNHLG